MFFSFYFNKINIQANNFLYYIVKLFSGCFMILKICYWFFNQDEVYSPQIGQDEAHSPQIGAEQHQLRKRRRISYSNPESSDLDLDSDFELSSLQSTSEEEFSEGENGTTSKKATSKKMQSTPNGNKRKNLEFIDEEICYGMV